MIFIGLLLLTVIIALSTSLFVGCSPQFGRAPSEAQKAEYSKTELFKDGIFVNTNPVAMKIEVWKTIKVLLNAHPNSTPQENIAVQKIDSANIMAYNDTLPRLTWFGHSSFLLEIGGKKILLDPMLSEVPAPHPWLGGSRYSKELPIEIEKLPFIDAVIFSHDHYDHLDYETIQKIKEKVGHYFVPLAVGNHLQEWGVETTKITEMKWWEETKFEGLNIVCTPARHFSGRGLFDRFSTLWASWVIQSANSNIFFSGDGGYDSHFKEIGNKYGPFDIALMECGQYNKQWADIHMMPEETAQAAVDVQAKLFMPIHWGAFTLAVHSWIDPIVRSKRKAAELNMPITTPQIGAPFIIGKHPFPVESWWERYK